MNYVSKTAKERARAIIFINSFMCVCFSRRVYLLFAGVAVDADIFFVLVLFRFVSCVVVVFVDEMASAQYLNNILHTHEMCGYE